MRGFYYRGILARGLKSVIDQANRQRQSNDTTYEVSQSEFEFVQDLGPDQQASLIQEFDAMQQINNFASDIYSLHIYQ